jgi:hypothetical protein
MTADEWDVGDDLWDQFDAYRHRDRNRLRALTCACARRVLEVAGPAAHSAFAGVVDVAERYAGGRATRAELLAARKLLRQSIKELRGTKAKHKGLVVSAIAELTDDTFEGFEYMLQSAGEVLKRTSGRRFPAVKGMLSTLIRDIFGNPFRSVVFDPAWRTGTAVSLARQMYEGREFSAMPILADAIQDAGCEEAAILDHCRGSGPHVRGCWVVDLVLGKA